MGTGKRGGQSTGAGLALPDVEVPVIRRKPSPLATIIINIARVGDIEGMADSGAVCTVIREDVVAHLAHMFFGGGNYLITFEGDKVRAVGEIALSVRYLNTVTEMKRVRVVKNSLYPVILGEDWFAATRAFVGHNGTRMEVFLQRPLGLISESEARSEANAATITRTSLTSVKPKESRAVTTTLPPIPEEDMPMSAIETEAVGPEENWAISNKDIILPAKSLSFVETTVSGNVIGDLLVERTGSSEPSAEWTVPSCLISQDASGIRIPVMNMSESPIRWRAGKLIASVTPYGEETDKMSEIVLEDEGPFSSVPITERTVIGDHLNNEEKESIAALLTKFEDCFTDGETVGTVEGVVHRIDTGDARPISLAPRRTSFEEKRIIAEQVAIMLDKGVIEPSQSPWSAAVVLTKRKNGSPRFCVDYRALNAVTKRDVYPMPRADDLIQRFEGAKYFSSMDVRNGFWHVPIHDEDKEKTAFVTPEGLFQFKKVPFGLTNSPATFMRFIDHILSGLKWTHCLAYLDDIMVYGTTFQEHYHGK